MVDIGWMVIVPVGEPMGSFVMSISDERLIDGILAREYRDKMTSWLEDQITDPLEGESKFKTHTPTLLGSSYDV